MTPEPPARAVDAPSPAQSSMGGLTTTAHAALNNLCAELDALHAENGALRHDLDAARSERDTAKADLAYYRTHFTRSGVVTVSRPLLLDLFCGAGGAAVGYHRAGFDVVGVDIEPQPNYPFEFIQGDALKAADRIMSNLFVDAIHASPPCQHHTTLAKGNNANTGDYPNLIAPTRELLKATGLRYVIENVPSAPLLSPITLCGEMFGLSVIRHRLFESDTLLMQPPHPPHRGRVAGYRHGERFDGPYFAVYGDGGGKGSIEDWRAAMGIDWMQTKHELAESIPPAYAEYIGAQLIQAL